MKIVETSISGVWIIEGKTFQDHRGAFSRLFCSKELETIISPKKIVQINHSKTHKVGALRGLHYQKSPHAEMKIVRCIKGRVFDVAVDLRKNSPSFLKWTAVELTAEKNISFVIPEGCAHGFQVLEKDSELLYLHTEFYTPDAEGALRFDDPKINIKWPLEPNDLSKRDLSHKYIENNFKGE